MTTKEQRDELRKAAKSRLQTIAAFGIENMPRRYEDEQRILEGTLALLDQLDSQQPASVDALVELDQRATLLQRVMDIYAGVIGSFVDSDYSLSHPEHDGHNLRRLSTIFTQMTGGQCDDDWLCGHWETPAKASDYLFSLGIGVSSPSPAEKGQADARTYEDGLRRAAEICENVKPSNDLRKDWAAEMSYFEDGLKAGFRHGTDACAEAIEQESKR